MRLLVTGGAGFIGSRIVSAALARGWQVRLLDSLRADVHPVGASVPGGVEFLHADAADSDAAAAAVQDVDVVCHQAAKVGLGVDFSDAPDYVHSNDLATAVLLAAAAEAEVRRLVLASSMVVYGEGAYRDAVGIVAAPPRRRADLEAGMFEPRSPRTGEPLEPLLVDEDAPLDPRNVYAVTKVAQEHLAAAWARETGGRVAALRYHNVYGPGMPQATPYAGVAALFRSALEAGEPPLVFEDGGQRRDFVHVDDVAAANVAALEWTASALDGRFRAFNIGSGEVRTVGDVATALSSAMAGPAPIVTGRYRMGDVRHITASSRRAREELGWRPAVTFEAGMAEFAGAPMRAPAEGAMGPLGARARTPTGDGPRRPAEDGPMRPAGDRPVRPAEDGSVRLAEDGPVRPAGDGLVRPAEDGSVRLSEDRPVRPAENRPMRPTGDRPIRPVGDAPVRPPEDGPMRAVGDPPVRPAGDAPVRPAGER